MVQASSRKLKNFSENPKQGKDYAVIGFGSPRAQRNGRNHGSLPGSPKTASLASPNSSVKSTSKHSKNSNKSFGYSNKPKAKNSTSSEDEEKTATDKVAGYSFPNWVVFLLKAVVIVLVCYVLQDNQIWPFDTRKSFWMQFHSNPPHFRMDFKPLNQTVPN